MVDACMLRTTSLEENVMPIPSRPIPELAREINRRQIDQCFANAHFPADRKQIVNYARDHFASEDFLAVLDSIPDKVYTNPAEIMQAIQSLGTGGRQRQA